jgi:hypothetical protein
MRSPANAPRFGSDSLEERVLRGWTIMAVLDLEVGC